MVASENIGQFERNPHLETTTRARLNPKHVDVRTRIVKVTASKISQTVRGWHVGRCGRVRQDTGKSFGRVSRGKLSTVAKKAIVILLNLLYQMIWLDISWRRKVLHTGAKGCACAGTASATPTSRCMCMYGTSGYYAECHSQKGDSNHTDEYRLQVVGEGDKVPRCNWVRRRSVDTAFHLA